MLFFFISIYKRRSFKGCYHLCNKPDVRVFLWCDNVTVLQPDNIWQWVSDGFNSQLNKSALFYSNVLQLLHKLRSC